MADGKGLYLLDLPLHAGRAPPSGAQAFPGLGEKLERHRIHFVDIDLRWGVTREYAENDKVQCLCLQLIDESRPFFIGLLGERYGLVPESLPEDARAKYDWITAPERTEIFLETDPTARQKRPC